MSNESGTRFWKMWNLQRSNIKKVPLSRQNRRPSMSIYSKYSKNSAEKVEKTDKSADRSDLCWILSKVRSTTSAVDLMRKQGRGSVKCRRSIASFERVSTHSQHINLRYRLRSYFTNGSRLHWIKVLRRISQNLTLMILHWLVSQTWRIFRNYVIKVIEE